jgi:hypothetical protein
MSGASWLHLGSLDETRRIHAEAFCAGKAVEQEWHHKGVLIMIFLV